jgi:hypothetical protein
VIVQGDPNMDEVAQALAPHLHWAP